VRLATEETCSRYLFIANVGSKCTVTSRNKYVSWNSRKDRTLEQRPLRPVSLDKFAKFGTLMAFHKGKKGKQKLSIYFLAAQNCKDHLNTVYKGSRENGGGQVSKNSCRQILTLASFFAMFLAKPFNSGAEMNAHYMRKSSLIVPREALVREESENAGHPSVGRKRVVTVATTLQPILRTEGNTQKTLDFNTLLALYFLTFVALVRLCYLVVVYFQQRQREKKMQQEREAAAETVSTIPDDADAIENFRRRMNEFSVETDDEEDEEDDLESEEEELRNGRRRSIDGRRFSGGWRKGGVGIGRSSPSSPVFERPNDKDRSKEGPSSGVSPEQIEMLKRMYGGDIHVDDEDKDDKDKKDPK